VEYRFKAITKCPFCDNTDFNILGKRLNHSQGLNPHKKTGITTTVVKCKRCGLIFPNPLPVPKNISDHYGVPPEQYWKPDYFNVNENHLNGFINWMNNVQPIDKGSKILDIGAGLGRSMIAFEKHGYDAYGVEPSEPFYHRAIEKLGVKKDKLKLSMIENCNYKENSFDVVVFSAVLEHLYAPAMVLEKAMSWLKPNGLMFIEVPSANWVTNKIYNFIYRIRGKDYVGNLSPMHQPYHLYEFSKKSFELHSLKHNYEIADSKNYVCQTFMPKIIDPVYKMVYEENKHRHGPGNMVKKKVNCQASGKILCRLRVNC